MKSQGGGVGLGGKDVAGAAGLRGGGGGESGGGAGGVRGGGKG